MSTHTHKTVVHRFVNEFKNEGGSMTSLDNLAKMAMNSTNKPDSLEWHRICATEAVQREID
ncbi:MAG: hypothetical protein M3P08_20145 [Thermoproteota archaeon]|jgi:uncharacterized protein (UPF0332 family)|nr:hypothetical protein [Thermoproteota archaeon]MRN69551.1 hypothetical protein [Nitrosopumilales archaeon]